jgi:CARDB
MSVRDRTRFPVALALFIGLLSSASPVSGAAGRPDLVVKQATVTTGSVMAGGRFDVSDVTKNVGTAAGGRSRTSYSLSVDDKPGTDTLVGRRKVPALKRGKRSASAVKTFTVPVSLTPGSYRLIACADSARAVGESNEKNNCEVGGTVTVTSPSSHGLIDQAIGSGELTEEQGLLFKVYSDFLDPRLPARYDVPPTGLEHGALEEVAEKWDSLSIETQVALRPFVTPPYHAGSYWSPSAPASTARGTQPRVGGASPWCIGNADIVFEDWEFVDTSGGEVRVWWQTRYGATDRPTAENIRDELQDKIIPALTSLMGRGPKSDGGAGASCSGGSDALDIALADVSTGTTFPNDGCRDTDVRMIFPRTASSVGWRGLLPYVAHEYMHAIQFSYATSAGGLCGGGEYAWLKEATAQWAQDYLSDPSYGIGLSPNNTEQDNGAPKLFLDSVERPLETESPPNKRPYGAYLLPFYMVRKGNLAAVPQIWTNTLTNNSLDAVDKVLSGGFKDAWPEFALYNWNRGPVDFYNTWDSMSVGAKTEIDTTLGVGGGTIETDIEHLAAKYYRFEFGSGVRKIKIDNPYVGDPDARVQAVLTLKDGTEKTVDWSAETVIELCRDLAEENVTELVIIISNSSKNPATKLTKPLGIATSKTGCVCKPARLVAAEAGPDGSIKARISGEAGCGVTGTINWGSTSTANTPTLTANYSWAGTVNIRMKPAADDPSTEEDESLYALEDAGSSYSFSGGGSEHGTDGADCYQDTTANDQGSGTFDGEDNTISVSAPGFEYVSIHVRYTYRWQRHSEYYCDGQFLFETNGDEISSNTLDVDPQTTDTEEPYTHYEDHQSYNGSNYSSYLDTVVNAS